MFRQTAADYTLLTPFVSFKEEVFSFPLSHEEKSSSLRWIVILSQPFRRNMYELLLIIIIIILFIVIVFHNVSLYIYFFYLSSYLSWLLCIILSFIVIFIIHYQYYNFIIIIISSYYHYHQFTVYTFLFLMNVKYSPSPPN